jgi:hypothetical protein
VLSIPSFTWYEANYTPTDARSVHTCHVVGSRQMLVVGGFEADVGYGYNTKDAFPQGLGIFDLTDMQWKDQYDADAESYVTPKVIKEGIAMSGMYPQKWDNPLVESWIIRDKSSDITPKSSKHRSSAGLIAGSVVSGVVALALMVSLMTLCWRRRYLKASQQGLQSPDKTSQTTSPRGNHLNPAHGKVGLDGRHRRYEMEPRQIDNDIWTGKGRKSSSQTQ